MISPLVFSRDRPAQLDLLLHSLEVNGSQLLPPVVLYTATDEEFWEGYALCTAAHPSAIFVVQTNFERDVRRLIRTYWAQGFLVCFCDDNVLYLPLADMDPQPVDLLELHPEVLCVSLRLGLNTTYTYPHDFHRQDLPPMAPINDALVWDWATAGPGDLNYPYSLDGHVFRTLDVLNALEGKTFRNPNMMEDSLVSGFRQPVISRHRMAAYYHSCLVGLPLNRTTQTHQSNRVSGLDGVSLAAMNSHYLAGERLSIDTVIPARVNSAHCEFEPVWVETDSHISEKTAAEVEA